MKSILLLLLISVSIIGSATLSELSTNQVEAQEVASIDVLETDKINRINITVDENNLIQLGLAGRDPYQCINQGRACTNNAYCGPGGECTIQTTTGYRRCVCR